MRIAITADWLTTFGGAEHVIAEFHKMFPNAPLFTSVAKRDAIGPLRNADIRVSNLQKWYDLLQKHQILLSRMPRAMESLDLRGYDVILSSSHAVGKGIIPGGHALHVCYCHTPMRYAWEMEEDYLRDFRVPRLLRPLIRRKLAEIRRWDLTTAKRVDVFLANSTTTQERIRRIYGRESIVIPPPVDDAFLTGSLAQGSPTTPYYLAVGRLVPYKRFDLLIEAANALKLPLKIAGKGQDEKRLRRMAGPTVEFLGFVPDDQLPALYGGAQALLFPQYEDAGIVLLEAQACGTPAIAYKAGGAVDIVQEGKTGILFQEQSLTNLRDALGRFGQHSWAREAIRESAKQFSQQRFRERIKVEIEGAYEKLQQNKDARGAGDRRN